jgi:hypothetical protein
LSWIVAPIPPKPAPTMTTSNCWVPIIRRPYSTPRRRTAHSAGRAAGQTAIQLPSRTPWVVSNRSCVAGWDSRRWATLGKSSRQSWPPNNRDKRLVLR